MEAAEPIFLSFMRLSRGRDTGLQGEPRALKYRDIRDESERCVCDVPAPIVEQLLTVLDDAYLGHIYSGRHNGFGRNK